MESAILTIVTCVVAVTMDILARATFLERFLSQNGNSAPAEEKYGALSPRPAQPLEPPFRFFVPNGLPMLGTAYKWNPTV